MYRKMEYIPLVHTMLGFIVQVRSTAWLAVLPVPADDDGSRNAYLELAPSDVLYGRTGVIPVETATSKQPITTAPTAAASTSTHPTTPASTVRTTSHAGGHSNRASGAVPYKTLLMISFPLLAVVFSAIAVYNLVIRIRRAKTGSFSPDGSDEEGTHLLDEVTETVDTDHWNPDRALPIINGFCQGDSVDPSQVKEAALYVYTSVTAAQQPISHVNKETSMDGVDFLEPCDDEDYKPRTSHKKKG